MEKTGIIFDLDGTLWEVIEATYINTNKITSKYKLKEISRETICKVFGLNRQDAAKLYFPDMEQNKALKLMDEIAKIKIEDLKTNGGNIYPNTIDVLNKLKEEYDLYIVSNTGEKEYISAYIKTSKTQSFFKDYIAASELRISKGEAIKKVIEDNKLKKALYVGDTIKDLEASDIAGIPFVQAKYGFGEDLKTQYYINSLKELPQVVKKVFDTYK